MTSSTEDRGALTDVLYVESRNAKTVKVFLEQQCILNREFRMARADALSPGHTKCISIPVLEYEPSIEQEHVFKKMVVAKGMQFCPYSSAMLGNHRLALQTQNTASMGHTRLTRIQQALLQALVLIRNKDNSKEDIVEKITKLDAVVCPKKLELLGDDKTLVIPRRAFSTEDATFYALLESCITKPANENVSDKSHTWTCPFMTEIWKELAGIHGSPRVARRGDIDPESKIRESGHVLLWPIAGIPNETGPGSPGWITVTEQGIKQSFDLTRVMFSRGNITEKIRFGQRVVQENDVVLDLYAGIGYYTLPALIHGKASHVYACEWNQHAAEALCYNLKANRVQDKATVLIGDCRVMAREHSLVHMFDRVSLGLLPSSEGGWRTAVRALRSDKGGWLHVHANVPDRELLLWQLWMCRSLHALVLQEKDPNQDDQWIVLCTHVEQVKSFAPMIHHYVADVFVGPRHEHPRQVDMDGIYAGTLVNGKFVACPNDAAPPSCALSATGVLNQKWMMDNEGK